jgi:hypothetical protein
MASSISHSNGRIPSLALALAAVAVLSWMGCAVYSLWWSPETRFATEAARTKQKWARELSNRRGPKFLVFGGSSCLFSIDGERMLNRHQVPLVNMGLLAGYGPKTITEWTLSETRRGDTLIVAVEPNLTGDALPTAAGIQFSFAMGAPHWISGILQPQTTVGGDDLLALRPGGYHTFTFLGKVFQGRPLYRYFVEDIRPSGWATTAVKIHLQQSPGAPQKISAAARTLLHSLADWSRTNDVRICYSLPLAWCPPAEAASLQRENAAFLVDISEILPVLEDPRLGILTNSALFADTAWHLNSEGAALRTDELASQLRAWRMWSRSSLEALVSKAQPLAQQVGEEQ